MTIEEFTKMIYERAQANSDDTKDRIFKLWTFDNQHLCVGGVYKLCEHELKDFFLFAVAVTRELDKYKK